MSQNIVLNALTTSHDNNNKIRGTVVLMKRNKLDFNDLGASVVDSIDEFLGKRVSLHLISAAKIDPAGQYMNSDLL